MKYQMICTENDRVIMRDPRVFDEFSNAEYALKKRLMADGEEYNWSIAVV